MKKCLSILLSVLLLCTMLPLGAISVAAENVYECLKYTITDGKVTITGYTADLPANVVIPETIEGYPVTAIGYRAFLYNNSMSKVTIGNNVATIGSQAFFQCGALNSVTIGDGVTTIGSEAFSRCYALRWVSFGNSVTTIGDYAFWSCQSLASVTLPDSVTVVGIEAFYQGMVMNTLTIGSGLAAIGDRAFCECQSLTSVTVDPDNANYCVVDGVLFSKDMTKVVKCPALKQGAYVIPDSVTTIGADAFCKCRLLASITLPDGITSIGDHAFRGCHGASSINIPDGVTSIGNSAFDSCKKLTSITIPNSVTSIGNSAFSYCSGLTSITIPDGVTHINEYAFNYCSKLISITLPNDVTHIGDFAFRGCSELTSVALPDGITHVGESAFDSCSALTSITLPNSVTHIAVGAFSQCTSLTDVYYGGSKADKTNIVIDDLNDDLLNATWHYNCIAPEDHYSPDVENSVMDTEEGNGLAYKFDLKLNGLQAVQGNRVDFTNATVNYKGTICKVVAMGAVLSNVENKKMELSDVNGATVIDVPVVYLQDLEPDSCQFAVRIINIPDTALDRTIYARPYYVIETPDGDTVTVYGKISSASCAEYM